jgi:hypothetical protein
MVEEYKKTGIFDVLALREKSDVTIRGKGPILACPAACGVRVCSLASYVFCFYS